MGGIIRVAIEVVDATTIVVGWVCFRLPLGHERLSLVIEQFDYPAEDPSVLGNRYIMELDHPSHGKVKSLGFPIFMSDTPARLERLAPCVGQHSGKVLQELLGYSQDDIYQLTADGVISQ